MKAAAALLPILLLAGCGAEQEDGREDLLAGGETEFDRLWTGNLAVLDEYRIQATFPADSPVCIADSGADIHGFYQWLGADCADESEPSSRFLSVWGNYNAAAPTPAQAKDEICGAGTQPFDLDVEPVAEGELFACLPEVCGEAWVVTAGFVPSPRGGAPRPDPQFVYRIALGTTAQTEAQDLATLRHFLSELSLAGVRFSVG